MKGSFEFMKGSFEFMKGSFECMEGSSIQEIIDMSRAHSTILSNSRLNITNPSTITVKISRSRSTKRVDTTTPMPPSSRQYHELNQHIIDIDDVLIEFVIYVWILQPRCLLPSQYHELNQHIIDISQTHSTILSTNSRLDFTNSIHTYLFDRIHS